MSAGDLERLLGDTIEKLRNEGGQPDRVRVHPTVWAEIVKREGSEWGAIRWFRAAFGDAFTYEMTPDLPYDALVDKQ